VREHAEEELALAGGSCVGAHRRAEPPLVAAEDALEVAALAVQRSEKAAVQGTPIRWETEVVPLPPSVSPLSAPTASPSSHRKAGEVQSGGNGQTVTRDLRRSRSRQNDRRAVATVSTTSVLFASLNDPTVSLDGISLGAVQSVRHVPEVIRRVLIFLLAVVIH